MIKPCVEALSWPQKVYRNDTNSHRSIFVVGVVVFAFRKGMAIIMTHNSTSDSKKPIIIQGYDGAV